MALMEKPFDDYFNRVYNRDTYNCAHLVCEAWEDITGNNISEAFKGFLQPASERTAELSVHNLLKRSRELVDPCIVLMTHPNVAPHVGIYTKGKVLHIREIGVHYQPLNMATFGYTNRRFYTCKTT